MLRGLDSGNYALLTKEQTAHKKFQIANFVTHSPKGLYLTEVASLHHQVKPPHGAGITLREAVSDFCMYVW